MNKETNGKWENKQMDNQTIRHTDNWVNRHRINKLTNKQTNG